MFSFGKGYHNFCSKGKKLRQKPHDRDHFQVHYSFLTLCLYSLYGREIHYVNFYFILKNLNFVSDTLLKHFHIHMYTKCWLKKHSCNCSSYICKSFFVILPCAKWLQLHHSTIIYQHYGFFRGFPLAEWPKGSLV